MVWLLPTAANSRNTSRASAATSALPSICGTARTAICPLPKSAKSKPYCASSAA